MFLRIFAIILVAQTVVLADYDRWIELIIANAGEDPINVTGSLEWGKWYTYGDKNQETTSPNNIVHSGESIRVCACGRSNSTSGTEGIILVWDPYRESKLASTSFKCPWSGTNNFTVKTHQPYSYLHFTQWKEKGALGVISLRVFHSSFIRNSTDAL